jgi:hypothetical protein
MTSRRSLPRPSSGSSLRRAAHALAGLAATLALAAAAFAAEPPSPPLVEKKGGVEIDWGAGTIKTTGGAAADLRMPSADVARAGAVRRAEAAAHASLKRALAVLPLGGGRKLTGEEIDRADSRGRVTNVDYQSNGGALVQVTTRFGDWLSSATDGPAPPVAVFAVPAMPLVAAPLVRVGGKDVAVGAARYRLGPGSPDAHALKATGDRAGHLVVGAAQRRGDDVPNLAGGVVLIFVEKVTR